MTEFRPRSPGRPRAKDADEKTARILTKAAELFASQGFNKTSFASVAEAVGLTLPGLTHYFPRKIDLLQAVLENRDTEMFDKGEVPKGHDIFGVLDAMMQRDTTSGADLTKLFIVLSVEAMSKEHPAHDWFEARTTRTLASMERRLKQLQTAGVLKPEIDCTAEAIGLLAMMQGIQTWWLHKPDDIDATKIFAAFLDRAKARMTV